VADVDTRWRAILTAHRPRIVGVADEDHVVPEWSTFVSSAGEPAVLIASRRVGRALLLAIDRGVVVVDSDQPLQAQLRAVDRVLMTGECGTEQAVTAEGIRRYVREADRVATLTARESQVLDLLMSGGSAGEIAEHLVVSLPTVRTHIQSITRKLRVSSQLAAAAVACRSRCGLGSRRCQSHEF
jgi:DNA-binding NarL/FixJ family response regulator